MNQATWLCRMWQRPAEMLVGIILGLMDVLVQLGQWSYHVYINTAAVVNSCVMGYCLCVFLVW